MADQSNSKNATFVLLCILLVGRVTVGGFASGTHISKLLVGRVTVGVFASGTHISKLLVGGVAVGVFASRTHVAVRLFALFCGVLVLLMFVASSNCILHLSDKSIYHNCSPCLTRGLGSY